MQELIHNLGLDWKLLLAQAVNFFIVLIALRLFLYKPVLRMLATRREKIEEGLAKSEEAERKLHEAAELKKERMKEAEQEALRMMHKAEIRAKEEAEKILRAASDRDAAMAKAARERMETEKMAERKKIFEESAAFIRQAIIKTVEMNPKDIDEKLVEKAIKEMSA